MYACMHACIMHACIMHACVHACMQSCMHAIVHACMSMHVWAWTRMPKSMLRIPCIMHAHAEKFQTNWAAKATVFMCMRKRWGWGWTEKGSQVGSIGRTLWGCSNNLSEHPQRVRPMDPTLEARATHEPPTAIAFLFRCEKFETRNKTNKKGQETFECENVLRCSN